MVDPIKRRGELMSIYMEYDKKGDAIYIYLKDEPVDHTERLDDLRYVDYARDGTLVGIELLCVSEGVITNDLPKRTEVEALLEKHNIKIFA
jgi:uncharacterized protein YuzE